MADLERGVAMATSQFRRLAYVALAVLLAAPVLAWAQAEGVPDAPPAQRLSLRGPMGVPDAPPVERILARHEGFTFPRGFETPDGRHLPKGTYDLLLVEAEGQYFIQMMNTETLKGIRVAAETTGALLQEVSVPPVPSVQLRSEAGRDSFLFVVGEFTARVPLGGVHQSG